MLNRRQLAELFVSQVFSTLLGLGAIYISGWSYFQTYDFFYRGTQSELVSHAFAALFQYGQGMFLYKWLRAEDRREQIIWGSALLLSLLIDAGTNNAEFFLEFPLVGAGVLALDPGMVVLAITMVAALTVCVFAEEFLGKWLDLYLTEWALFVAEAREMLDRSRERERRQDLRRQQQQQRPLRRPEPVEQFAD